MLNETFVNVSGWNASYALPTAAAVLASAVLYSTLFTAPRSDATIHPLGGLSILTAWQFFNRRFDFLKSNFSETGQNMFSFKVLHARPCIAIARCDIDDFSNPAFGRRYEGRGCAKGVF